MDFENFITELKKPSNYVLTRYFKSFLSEFNKKEWDRSRLPQIIADFITFITGKSLPLFANSPSLFAQLSAHAQQAISNATRVGDESPLFITSLNESRLTQLPSSANSQPVAPWKDADELHSILQKHWLALVQQKLYQKLFVNVRLRFENDQIEDRCGILRQFIEIEHFRRGDGKLDISQDLIDEVCNRFTQMNECKLVSEKLACIVSSCKYLLSQSSQKDSTQAERAHITVDDYLPILIFCIIKRYPRLIYCNCRYIELFEQELRTGEGAYYYTNVMSALHYIRDLQANQLNIDADFYHQQLALLTPLPPSPPFKFMANQISNNTIRPSTSQTSLDSIQTVSSTSTGVVGLISKYLGQISNVANKRISQAISSGSPVSASTDDTDEESRRMLEEENYQLQLAMALSLSETQNLSSIGTSNASKNDQSLI